MSGLFRSEEMTYVQVLLPQAVAEEFADAVAREGCMQFEDLNEDFQPFQRQYTREIIQIQDIERTIKTIEEQLEEYKINFNPEINRHFLQHTPRQANASQIIATIQDEVNAKYKSLKEQAGAEQQLNQELNTQDDTIRVVRQMDKFLANQYEAQQYFEEKKMADNEHQTFMEETRVSNAPNQVPLLEMQERGNQQARQSVGFRYFAGVVTIAQKVAFERQVFLTSRGNSFVQFDDDPENPDTNKIPFVVFFLGDQLKKSLKRLCQFMNIQICYESDSDRPREELLKEADQKKDEYYRIHHATKRQLQNAMKEVAAKLDEWKLTLSQEKSIRITLNQFRTHQANVLRAEGWIPTSKMDRIQHILDQVTQNKGVGNGYLQKQPNARSQTPTYFETNDFTGAFQAIVDTYGVPRYREFNPAVPTMVTFPFLFGVMYGDMFHGSCLFLFAAFLCFGGKYVPKDALSSIYGGRYVLLLMGAFAIYCGMIYNDMMSISIDGWNTAGWGTANARDIHTGEIYTNVQVQAPWTYAVGIDPAWHAKTNQLEYGNSLKMKLSVIFGVTQMTFGLFLKLSNHINERDMISVFCEFVPQLIFMCVFFIYMLFLIVYKWCLVWTNGNGPYATPSILTILIKMMLNPSPGAIDSSLALYDPSLQGSIQFLFLILMFGSIPWMLFIKPFLLKAKWNRQREQGVVGVGHGGGGHSDEEQKEEEDAKPAHGGGHGGHGHGDEFDFGEVFIHQLIHTIEYVLGTISNTASYLRLWALSLAHAELSEVFYEKTIQQTLEGTGATQVIMAVVGVFMFFMFTGGVLLVMDVLECFLHALRLHWVEFQNKFYYADGVAFKPFTYSRALDEE